MQAIIRQGDGKYYISTVFGYYKDITAKDDYQRYVESIHKPYWIVWDAEHKKLIRWLNMVPNTKYLIPQVLIIDVDTAGWNMDADGVGCVNFLTREFLDSFLDSDTQPEAILEQCHKLDRAYTYDPEPEIRTERDVENLMSVSGYFHDARIAEEKILEDGTLYLHFDGTWGCEIDVWFWGELEYCTDSRSQDECNEYWYGSSVILQDGFVLLCGRGWNDRRGNQPFLLLFQGSAHEI